MPADVLGGAIVTGTGRDRLGSVERSLGRKIERDPPCRRGRPNRLCPKLNLIR